MTHATLSRGSYSLSALQRAAYSIFMLPLSLGWVALMMYIPAYYAVDMGLGLAVVGAIMAAGRAIDLISDPLIGILSDKTRSRFGRRKPWSIVGLPIFCIAVWFLFQPSPEVSGGYLFFFATLYFIGFTMSELPHASLGMEVSDHRQERSWLSAGKMLIFIGGGLVGAALPVILALDTLEALRTLARGVCLTTLAVLPFFIWFMPGKKDNKQADMSTLTAAAAPKIDWRAVMARKDITLVVGVNFIVLLGGAFSSAMSLLYAAYVLGEPEKLGLFWMASGVGFLIAMPLWVVISARIGKMRAWALSNVLAACAAVPLLFLGEGQWAVMIAVCLATSLAGGANAFMAQSILADCIAGDSAEGGGEAVDSAGLIAAIKNGSAKIAAAGPMLIAFPILGAIGLAGGQGGANLLSATVLEGGLVKIALVGFYAGLPIAAGLAAGVVLMRRA